MNNDILEKILKYHFDKIITNLKINFPNNLEDIASLEHDYFNFTKLDKPFKYSAMSTIFEQVKETFKSEFKSLGHINNNYPTEMQNAFKEKFGTLTFKEAFCLDYYKGQKERCCFCGAILPKAIKRKKNKEEYMYSDYDYVQAEVEHIFPQSKFPQLILHYYNLAPICRMCNNFKNNDFFKSKDQFDASIKELSINYSNLHPLTLWKSVALKTQNISAEYQLKTNIQNNKLLEYYEIQKRTNILFNNCYEILFNIIKNSDIRSPESLEKLLENMTSANWHEINDGYSLNNSPQIWQEFIEYILYDENNLLALWEEVKDYSRQISCFNN